jgi:diguanylate cyclase (GGDEF)-like protein
VNIPTDLLKTLQSCRTLPSVPAVAIQVLDLCQDPDVGTSKISKVISRDPALTARILKVANSAWCGVRQSVSTLNQAVNLLGLNGTLSLALSFSMVRSLQNAGGSMFDHLTYWRRSAIAANATVSAGAGQTTISQGELFLGGLFQDIGMLILAEALPSYGQFTVAAANDHNALVEIELRELGADHSQVGSWFLSNSKLPDSLVKAVSESHAQNGIEDMLAKAVAVGGQIADIWINPNIAAATESAAKAAKEIMGFSSDHFSQILTSTAEDLAEVTANLDIPIGNETIIIRMLDEARQALSEINMRAIHEVRSLAIQAQRDALTKLYNRAYLDQILEEQFIKSKAAGQPLTLIFIDIDKFKHINDSYGHNGGDSVLISVAQAIHSVTRSTDVVARFGGDEFVLLLNNTGNEIGALLAERIRSTVEKEPHDIGEGNHIHVTVSIGMTTLSSSSPFQSVKDLLETADRQLYAAKYAGRNRVAQAS